MVTSKCDIFSLGVIFYQLIFWTGPWNYKKHYKLYQTASETEASALENKRQFWNGMIHPARSPSWRLYLEKYMEGRELLHEGKQQGMEDFISSQEEESFFPFLIVTTVNAMEIGHVCYEEKDAQGFMRSYGEEEDCKGFKAYDMRVVKLLDGMLDPDPKRRFSFEDVLSSPSFKNIKSESAVVATISSFSGNSKGGEEKAKGVMEQQGASDMPHWTIAADAVNKNRDNAQRIPEAQVIDKFLEEVVKEETLKDQGAEELSDVCKQEDYRAKVRGTMEDESITYFDYEEELKYAQTFTLDVKTYNRINAVAKCYTTFEHGDEPVQTIALMLKLMSIFGASVDRSQIAQGKIQIKWPSDDLIDDGEEENPAAANNACGGEEKKTEANTPKEDPMELERKCDDNNDQKNQNHNSHGSTKNRAMEVEEKGGGEDDDEESRKKFPKDTPVVKASIEVFKHPTEDMESIVEVRDLSDDLDPSQFSNLMFDRILEYITDFNS